MHYHSLQQKHNRLLAKILLQMRKFSGAISFLGALKYTPI
jgi:hypothetical protein